MEWDERLLKCREFQTEGNAFYSEGQYERASVRYHHAITYFEYAISEAKIAQLIHLQIKQDELLVKIAAREKNQKKVQLNAQNVMLENRVLVMVARAKFVRKDNIVIFKEQ